MITKAWLKYLRSRSQTRCLISRCLIKEWNTSRNNPDKNVFTLYTIGTMLARIAISSSLHIFTFVKKNIIKKRRKIEGCKEILSKEKKPTKIKFDKDDTIILQKKTKIFQWKICGQMKAKGKKIITIN